MTDDPFDLQRFADAQAPLRSRVEAELRAGAKTSHWMWFVFPQLRGLGASPMAIRYGIASLEEARAYLAHPSLGPWLRDCTELVNAVEGRSVAAIFGSPDDMKLRSCMTLFSRATPDNAVFTQTLMRYFGGEADGATLQRLSA